MARSPVERGDQPAVGSSPSLNWSATPRNAVWRELVSRGKARISAWDRGCVAGEDPAGAGRGLASGVRADEQRPLERAVLDGSGEGPSDGPHDPRPFAASASRRSRHIYMSPPWQHSWETRCLHTLYRYASARKPFVRRSHAEDLEVVDLVVPVPATRVREVGKVGVLVVRGGIEVTLTVVQQA